MQSNHTPEPWSVSEESFDNDGIKESVIRGMDGRAAIAVTLDFGANNPSMREANARRIVACVNACAGISTTSLEGEVGVIESVTKFTSKKLTDVRQQRDELLAVCEELAECAAYWSEYDVPIGIADRLTAAIAKVKGGAA